MWSEFTRGRKSKSKNTEVPLWDKIGRADRENKCVFVVIVCHQAVLDGFDQHFQATVHFPLSSAID